MSGSIPPILWYLLVVAGFIWMVVGLSIQSRRDHTARMAALDIQRTYAEKGVEPPPAAQASGPNPAANTGWDPDWSQKPAKHKHGKRKGQFDHFGKMGSDLFMAGVLAALYWWRTDEGGPQWAIYVTGIFAAVFAIAAAAHMIAGIVATAGEAAVRAAGQYRGRHRDDAAD